MKNILTKLLLLQKKIQPIVKSEDNPYYSSSYFSIDNVIQVLKPILSDVGLVILQPLTSLDGKPAIKTMICDPESGECLESTVQLQESQDIQKLGGIITYMRRFCLTSMLLLQGEDDDDGNLQVKTVSAPRKEAALQTQHEEKECPKCLKKHFGKFPKCLDCWKKDKNEAAKDTVDVG